MSSRRPFFRRCIAAFLTLVACVTFVGSPIASRVAHAQAVTVVGNVPDDILRVLDQILTQLLRAGTVALFNAAQTFLGQLAYDAATYVASGGKGQNALTQSKSAGDYFSQVGQDALGSAIGSLSDEFTEGRFGFDLCAPSLGNMLNLQLSLGSFLPSTNPAFQRPRPNCSFQTIVQNYNQFATTLTGDQLLRNISANFNTNASEVGATLQIFGRTVAKVDTDIGKKKSDRAEDGAFKGVTDVVSGNVKTPAALVAANTAETLVEGPNRDEGQRRNAILQSAADQGVVQLLTYTASMFINTLGSKLMGRIMERGLINAFDFSDLEQQTGVANANPDALPSRSRADARRANLSLRDVNLIKVSTIEIVSELIACPDVRGTWNCVMDQQLAQAVQGNACDNGPCTVGKALERGLMKGDWRLYPDSMVRQNQDANCHQQAFCAGNLRKLRLMRILPVGFEFAANSDENIERCASAAGCVTLKEVVDGFSTCSLNGERDEENPWCKLIDPSWVLASFQQQCKLSGFSEQLISERLGQRKEECSDIQTCLKRNDKGECVGGFGYCMAEKTVYRFRGDECPAEAASCRNYVTRAGTAASYLRNTLDYGQCSADNVGCLGYATLRNPDGTWISAPSSTIYFDQTLKPCSAGDEGCTRLLAAEVGGTSLNLLTNPSFERTEGTPPALEAWPSEPAGAYTPTPLPAGGLAANGSLALRVSAGSVYTQRLVANPGTVMTLSVLARTGTSSDTPSLRVSAIQYTNDTFEVGARVPPTTVDTLFKSPSCLTSMGVVRISDPTIGTSDTVSYGTDWRRFECSFLTAADTRFIEVRVSGDQTFVDALQLEEGQFATNFVDGANSALPVVYMKVAPDDYQCTGASTDSELCSKFARICRQVDAGCQGYTDGTPAPEVPAILSANDLCPAECVGYAEYRKQGSAFDLVMDDDTRFDDPSDDGKSYLIPSTGQQCTQQDVGCEVFTNLEASAAGGEQTAAYSYLRLCEKPDSTFTQTYFTWEGSEAAGYQLRTWSLVSARGEGSEPKVVARRGPDGAFKDPASCNAETWRTGLDADCRQFYDRAGRVSYIFFSQTVLSSADCKPLRLSGRVNTNDCTRTGGRFNVSTGECVYNGLPAESLSCNIQFAGCRAYAGSGAGNIVVTINENFRSGRGVFSAGAASPESLLVGDQSLRLQSGGGSALTTSVTFPTVAGDLFRVSFWAKGVGSGSVLTVRIDNADVPGPSPVTVGEAALSGDWQRFSLGLFGGYAGAATSSLSWKLSGGASPIAFIDEVRVERIRDTAFVVKDSWTTPASCDQTFSGIPEPQAMLGCRQYTDRFNNKVNASRFTRLCRQEAIGCRAFVDTRNSESSASQTFVSSDASPVARRTFREDETPTPADFFPSTTTTRPADRMRYLVYETSKLCQSESMSCRAFGKPKYSLDRTAIESHETVYIKDDITAYGQALCRPSEEFCEEFTYQAARDYFKSPGDKACEFKDSIRLNAFDFSDDPDVFDALGGNDFAEGTYSGWFRKGTSLPCYPGNLQGGNFFGLPKRGDEPYVGWVGLCKPEHGECTEFRDPNDTSDPQHRTGRPYFFVDNSKLDKTTCSGNVDQGSGCILLRNSNDPTLNYSSLATDLAYRDNNFRTVQPIDCEASPNNEFCQGRCRGTKTSRFTPLSSPIVSPYVGGTCSVDTECEIAPEGCIGLGAYCATSYQLDCVKPQNDANVLVKVNTDRDCSQWLGCQSAETVFDPATNQYKDVCTNLALCNKSSDTPGDIFCANYVDRNNQSIEPILSQGKFFDVENYSSRRVGLGEKDYSGQSIPNSFQIPDTIVTRVGVDGALTVPDNENRFARDYRLAAVARIPVNLTVRDGSEFALITNPGPNEARVVEGSGIGDANPGLRLCQHVGSGIIGYYREEDRESATRLPGKTFFNCYLPIRRASSAYDFQNLANTFTLDDPRTDPVLSKAFPAPECRANPEADSPFPTKYVTGWDFSTNPPKATTKITGYQNAKACEYGEDCVCSYKRAEYEVPTLTKFFSPLASNVSPGVCFGGPRNGEACLPSAILQTNVGSATLQQGIGSANEQQLCGPPEQGGRCMAASKIEIIRGVFGQCLERDTTRILGDDRSAQPCLTWNPNPILFGDKDPFHYQPTSGYLPPQNSGQYYCTSPSRQPVAFKMSTNHFRRFVSGESGQVATPVAGTNRNVQLRPVGLAVSIENGQRYDPPSSQSDFTGSIGWQDLDKYEVQFAQWQGAPYYAGKMTRLDYGEQWVSPGNRCDPEDCDYMSSSLVAARPRSHYPSADSCEASDDTGLGFGGHLPNALRLVDAGNGYSETFFRINDKEFAEELGSNPDAQAQMGRFLSDNVIGYIKINPTLATGNGALSCGYQAEWADNMPPVDYQNAGSIRQGERQWRDDLSRLYNPFLNRGREAVLASGETLTSRAQKMPCLEVDNVVGSGESGDEGEATHPDNPFIEGDGAPSECYFKYWETGLRAGADQRKFESIYEAGSDDRIVRNLNDIRRNAFVDKCQSGKPYFAIRAMFQSRARNTEREPGALPDVTANEVRGPWRFVGFWVTACAGNAGTDQRYIYVDVEVGSAAVCTELAEVQSSGSRQDAAFTDRVWSQGGFREQSIGTSYGDAATPFSSAINTRPAGKEPLFQNGQELTGFSPLNPPAFLRSGVATYYKNVSTPRDKWAFLTNLFARVYRVYRFQFNPVNRGDAACALGPFKGTRCTTPGTATEDPACKLDGVCSLAAFNPTELSQLRVCNRGPGKGDDCQLESQCKAVSSVSVTGEVTSMLRGCVLNTGWRLVAGSIGASTARFDGPAAAGTGLTVQQAAAFEAPTIAFVCSPTSARAGQKCTSPTAETATGNDAEGDSPECPTAVSGSCRDTGRGYATGIRTCRYEADVQAAADEDGVRLGGRCDTAADCGFTSADYDAGACATAADVGTRFGRCEGGVKSGQLCRYDGGGSCEVNLPGEYEIATSCERVDSGSPSFIPTAACLPPNVSATAANTETNPDIDNNICTHGVGYQPRQDICPNPSDEYCGLISYDMRRPPATPPGDSLDPGGSFPFPTDVTLGHYTPTFLGFPSSAGINASTFAYITYYTPRPPRVAAPDTRNCPIPGQCPISRLDTVAFDGLSDGSVVAGGGQHKASLRFYAWAAHNQMPLRQVTIDWGDGKSQVIDDTRLKNRKPFCGVQKECELVAGLTCQVDSDCPPGAGRCVPVGVCENAPQRTCTSDTDCTIGGVRDTCRIRTMFGNAGDACQQDYFDFTHVYTCGANENKLPSCSSPVGGGASVEPGQCHFGPSLDGLVVDDFGSRPACSAVADCTARYEERYGPAGAYADEFRCGPSGEVLTTRCSRDPSRVCRPGSLYPASDACAPGDECIEALAPPSGCFDAASNSCRFTPRVMIQDNWGWCSGECRNEIVGGALVDRPGSADRPASAVRHPYGGCYVGNVFNGTYDQKTRFNTRSTTVDPGIRPENHFVTGGTPTDRLDKEGECAVNRPASGLGRADNNRPWIVYPGSLQLRRSDEIGE